MSNAVEIPLAGGFLKLEMPVVGHWPAMLSEDSKGNIRIETQGGFKLSGLKVEAPDGSVVSFADILVRQIVVKGEILPTVAGGDIVLFKIERPADKPVIVGGSG